VPGLSIIFVSIVSIVLSLVPGIIYGPSVGFAFLGTTLTLPIILVYLATCLSVPFYYLRQQRDEFNVLRHIIVPLIPFVILLFVLYFQFSPLPKAPLSFAGPIVALWLVIGLVIIFWLGARAPERLTSSSNVYVEDKDVQV
jgi:amino acid transporter